MTYTLHSSPAGVDALDALGAEAAERTQQLAAATDAKARPRKKKALGDFLKALGAAGVSAQRSAVPAAERGVQAWFAQVRLSWRMPPTAWHI